MLSGMRPHKVTTFCLGALLIVAGCKTYPVNEPLAERDTDEGFYFHTQPRGNNSSELLVVLAFSGGGTRAAAFSYGVLEQLRDTPIQLAGREKPLLHEVDAISSVSGGSVTAAAYGLYGDEVFGRLEDAFLKRNVQRSLGFRVINPFRWPSLWSGTYGRSELAAEFYDEILFNGATFADVQKADGPFLVINATDISTLLP
jgi:NTE family protein